VRGLKTRVWGFCRRPGSRAPVFGLQTTKPRRVAKAAATKTASGPSQWLSRDPIQENDGPNMYAIVGNDPINAFDAYGLRAYVARNSVQVISGTQTKRIKCGTIKLGTVYLDADPANSIPHVDPFAHGRITGLLPSTTKFTHSWKLLTDAHTLGGGFEISFDLNKRSSCACLCREVFWRQYVDGGSGEELDYSFPPSNSTADIPAVPRPYNPNGFQRTFRLQLVCRSDFGIESVAWEGRWVIAMSATSTQATVSLAIDL